MIKKLNFKEEVIEKQKTEVEANDELVIVVEDNNTVEERSTESNAEECTSDANTDEFDFSKLEPSNSKGLSKSTGVPGVLTIINSKKNGKRLTIAKDVMDKLNNPEKIQVAFTNEHLVIGESLPNNSNYFNIKKVGDKGIVYASKLVLETSERFSLDFSDRVSITFHDVRYTSSDDVPVAIITMKESF